MQHKGLKDLAQCKFYYNESVVLHIWNNNGLMYKDSKTRFQTARKNIKFGMLLKRMARWWASKKIQCLSTEDGISSGPVSLNGSKKVSLPLHPSRQGHKKINVYGSQNIIEPPVLNL